MSSERSEGVEIMELLDGRPENTDGRLPREVRTYDLLDSLGIEYKRTDHERTDTMEACNAVDDVIKKFLPAVNHDYRIVHLVGED